MEVSGEARYIRISVRKPLGKWLVDNIPRGSRVQVSNRREPERDIPFLLCENE